MRKTKTTTTKAAAAKTVKAAGEMVEKTVKEAAAKAEEVKTEVAEAVEDVVEEVKKTAEKAVEKAAKTTEKAAVKKTAAKKTVVKEEVYLQCFGKEVNKDDIMKQVKEIWTKQMKNKVGDMKSVTLYLKPEENKAYYVINGDVTGSVEL